MNENWIVALVSPRDVAVHPNFRETDFEAHRIMASRLKGWESSFASRSEDAASPTPDESRLLDASERAFSGQTEAAGAREDLSRLAEQSEDLALATTSVLFLSVSLADEDDYEPLLEALDAMLGRLQDGNSAGEVICRALVLLQRSLRNSESGGVAINDATDALRLIRSVSIQDLAPVMPSPGVAWDSHRTWQRVILQIERTALAHVATASPLSNDSSWAEEVRNESSPVQMEFTASANGGFERYIEERFNMVTKDPTVRWGGGDLIEGPIVRELMHQELLGSPYARHSRKVLGQIRLLRQDVHQGVDALRLLRQSGDKKEFAKGARFFRANGPLRKLQEEARAVVSRRPAAWWRPSDLEALALGGDLLDMSEASTAFEVLSSSIESARETRQGQFEMDGRATALGVMAQTAGLHEDLARTMHHFVVTGPQEQFLMNAYAKALRYVGWEAVGEDVVEAWRLWLTDGPRGIDHSAVRLLISGAVGISGASDVGEEDDIYAIAAQVNADTRLPATEVSDERLQSMSTVLISLMEGTRAEARSGVSSFGGINEASLAVMLCFRRPDATLLWEAVAQYLVDPLVSRDFKAEALDRLAAKSGSVPPVVLAILREHLDGLFASPLSRLSGNASEPFAAALRLCGATALVDDARLLSELVQLTSHEAPAQRLEGARTLTSIVHSRHVEPWAFALLVQLCRDRDATVRAHSGHGLARAASADPAFEALRQEILLGLLGEDAVLVPLFVLRGVAERSVENPAALPDHLARVVRGLATTSLSALVRQEAASLAGALQE